jgi:hypothetical protein
VKRARIFGDEMISAPSGSKIFEFLQTVTSYNIFETGPEGPELED